MKTVLVRSLFKESSKYYDKEVKVQGWVRTVRDSKNIGFIELNDGSFFKNIQIVYENNLNNFEEISKLTIAEREKTISEQSNKIETLEQEVKNLQDLNIANQKTINDWKSEAESCYKTIQEQKESISNLDKANLDYAASLEKTITELDEAKDKIKELEENSEILNSEVNSLNCKCVNLEEKLTDSDAQVKALEVLNSTKDQDNQRIKEQYAERITNISNAVNDIHNQLQSSFDIFSI